MKKIIFVFLVLLSSLYAGEKDPQAILNKVKENFNKVKDYKVTAVIKIDMDFLKVPDMNATIYYKNPDKIKFDSQGFAMLPKQAFNFSPVKFLDAKYTAFYVGSVENKTEIIKVIPDGDSSEVILTTLWIDSKKNVVKKIESTLRRGGTFQIEMDYGKNINYDLPSGVIFTFDAPQMNLPRKLSGKPDAKLEEKGKNTKHPGKGIVTIQYKDYKINEGIPDSFFAEKKSN